MYLNAVFLQGTPGVDAGGGMPGMAAFAGQLVILIGACVAVVVLAYYTTRLIAGAKFSGRRSDNLQIIDSLFVGQQCGILLVKAGEKFVLLGVSKERISFLTEISKDEVVLKQAGTPGTGTTFEKYLNSFLRKASGVTGGDKDDGKGDE